MIEKYLFQYEEKSVYPYRWILQRGTFNDTKEFIENLSNFFPAESFITLKRGQTFRIYFKTETSSLMFKLIFLDQYKFPEFGVPIGVYLNLISPEPEPQDDDLQIQ